MWVPPTLGYIPPTTVSGQVVKLALTHFNSNATAACDLYHELKGLDGLVGTIRAFEAALGLTKPEKVFWNAIPYSFVVDWVFKINERLDRSLSQPFEGTWKVSNCSFSFKEVAHVSVYTHFYYTYGNPATKVGSVVVKKYRRFTGLPFGGQHLSLGTLSPTQQTLFGALLLARTK